ncbi:MAG: ATP-binding protein, partial [Acidimicrobiia bacterium]
QLNHIPETAAEIAERVGIDEEEAVVLLEGMIPIRKVRADTTALETGGYGEIGEKSDDEVKKYRLAPFIVGWFEAYLQTRDPGSAEFGKMYEQYIIEGGGERVFAPRPGQQGVIPYRGSLSLEELKREPQNDIEAHFQRYDRFLVIDCVCKLEKAAARGHSCDMPIKRCGFIGMPPGVPLSENVLPREEASSLFAELDDIGTMVCTGFYGYTLSAETPQFVGSCHCCGCCCVFMNSARVDDNITETVQRSNYRAVKDYDLCINCGECVRRCQVFAHTYKETEYGKVTVYDPELCIGCGSCGMGCESNALHLEPIPDEERFHVASSFTEWEEQRLELMGLDS